MITDNHIENKFVTISHTKNNFGPKWSKTTHDCDLVAYSYKLDGDGHLH